MSNATQRSRKLSIALLITVLLLWLYSLWADRVTPTTDQAQVHSYLVRITPEVSGPIEEVMVSDNQIVDTDTPLLRIDPHPYEIALQAAKANLAIVGQSLGANTAAVEVAQAQVVQARAAHDNAVEQASRLTKLAKRGVMSQAQLDDAREKEQRTEAALHAAEASLVQAKRTLGPAGEQNPQLRSAMSKLEKAQLDRQRTLVKAPSHGIVSNLQLSPGQYLATGTPALTFIDPRSVWVSAMVRENSLEYIHPGIKVEMVFDALPGRVITGKVESIGWGTGGSNAIDQGTGFASLGQGTQSPQRFPVTIVFDGGVPKNLRYGSQAMVCFYTGESTVSEWLAWLWMRLQSVVTYVS